MPAVTLAMIIVASIFGYGFGAGMTYGGVITSGRDGDSALAFFGPILWPLVLPALLGAALVRRITTPRLPAARVHKELP